MKKLLHFFSISLVFFFLLVYSTDVYAQTRSLEYYIQTHQLESGMYNGSGELNSGPKNVYTGYVELHEVPWIQLHFSNVNLGKESYIIIKSLKDNLWQKLDAVSINQWNNYSAFFNDGAIEINLFVAPIDRQVFINVNEVVVGEWSSGDPTESQCGPTDDRTNSNQPATARLLNVGCTSWIIPNGKMVSAGHCLDGSSANVVQFNVPLSLPNGTLQHPGPEDQYSVDVATKVFTNGGVGNDWGVFEVFPNSITGLLPKEAQNTFWPLVQDLGPDSIRITGYGVDSGEDNQTQQTNIGPNAGSSVTTMRYVTDTEGGNSGSPVIDGLTNSAVGVHTHGGCTTGGSGNNNGTSTFHAAFWAAVEQGAGSCTVGAPSNPNPTSGQTNIPLNLAQLTWTNGAGAVSNELYFGTNPSSLALVQSGSLATSWTITGVTFTYGTNYYWQVVELGDSCDTNGPVWNFTTVQDPNIFIAFNETFNNLTCWSPIGPLGMTNWSVQATNNAGGSPPSELQLSWTPSFVGLSQLLSCTVNSSTAFVNTLSLTHMCDWYADPAPFMGIGITYDGGTTYSTLWEFQPVGGNVNPEEISVDFTPAQNSFQLVLFMNGDSFNIDFWYVDDIMVDYVVPVELTSFTANILKDGVELNWETATEINNQGFEIERKKNSIFEKIGYTAGFGTTTEPKSYSFVDSKVENGTYTYRLKQIDFDGSFTYSSEVNVDFEIPLNFMLGQNYPNPFNPSTKIKFAIPSETEVHLNVYNTLGQKVADIINGSLKPGHHEVVFDAASLTSGIYFYRLETDQFVDVKKMIIIK
ncbi:MAG: T9SS type A sorting domain-containing protein [Ignavibacteriales bacterium]